MQVSISITDTGCGIPPDKQAAIFEPFNQVCFSSDFADLHKKKSI